MTAKPVTQIRRGVDDEIAGPVLGAVAMRHGLRAVWRSGIIAAQNPVIPFLSSDNSVFRIGVIRQPRGVGVPLVIAATGMFFAGCRDDAASTPVESPPAAASATPRSEAATDAPAKAQPSTREIVATVDESGRKWLTPTVPYDVFPGLPADGDVATGAAEAAPAAPAVASAAPQDAMIAAKDDDSPASPMPMPQPTASAEPMAEMSPMPAAGDWGTLLPVEVLQSEIATTKNDLAEKLLTVGSYNAAFEQVSQDGWLLSALATIASEHPATISWKGDALLARDAAVAVAMAATARGRQNFSEAQLASEQLSGVLNNNTPAGLKTADASTSREETADRAALMARMQTALDRLKEAGADEAAFAASRTEINGEARLLGALAKFTAHADYASAEEPEYQASASALIAAASTMADAAENEDPAAYKTALDTVGTNCNKCHEKYRFEN